MHDVSYRYGFTEEKFNIQKKKFDKGGAQSDRVLLSIQDKSGVNANFATPPECVVFVPHCPTYTIITCWEIKNYSGQSGVCRSFIWDKPTVHLLV